MEKSIDFDRVAQWYDAYVRAEFDVEFWVDQARRHPGRRVELMCGTGRLSLPILRAGMELTCVDYSAGLLDVLREKLAREGLHADVLQRDVRELGLTGFDYAFIGFHAFSELSTVSDARAALRSLRRAVRPGGTLALSLHNPATRAAALDGSPREMGPFPLPNGNHLVVTGTYRLGPDRASVSGSQRYAEFDERGNLVRDDELPVRFRLIALHELEALAAEAGFAIGDRWGDYDRRGYDPESSAYCLFELR